MTSPMSERATPQAVVEMPKEDEYDEDAAQLANDNPIYALIIGNNDYQASEFSSLLGAVADADAIENILKASMGLRDSHIVSLRNATRQQMLDGFDKLEEITKDKEDPCMIIFYAGHGAQTPRPKGWEDYAADYEMIEMLCPSDLGVAGKDGKVVEGIPDRMVSALLNGLAEKRGNNITLILDCCHSAGLNRDEETDRISRSLSDPPPITAEANIIPTPSSQESLNGEPTRAVRVATGFGGKYATSHVLLAACGRNKRAFEDRKTKHGYFTGALINFLQGKKVESETYLSLMYNIVMPTWQTPHCMGVNADRPLFNRRGSRSDPSYIPCKVFETESTLKGAEGKQQVTFTLLAGLAEGIVPNEVFDLYKAVPFEGEKNAGPPFGMMIATNVGTTSTELQRLEGKTAPLRVPKVFYAKRIAWSNAPASIYCEDKTLLQLLSRVTKSSVSVKAGKVLPSDLVDDAAKASLILQVEGDDVYFERNDPFLEEHLPKRFPRPLNRSAPEQIQGVISAWRHFNYHLKRGGRDEFPQIRMEMHYLKPEDGDWDNEHPEYHPVGSNLLAENPAHIEVSDDHTKRPLGLTLYNDGDVDVYPYLFYFDPTELTIMPWPMVAEGAGGDVDPPLLRHSQLAVGYGNGGVDPLMFFFEGETVRDIGFFELFITYSPANFRSLNQERSPFPRSTRGGNDEDEDEDDIDPELEGEKRLQDEEELQKKMHADQWGVKVHTVVQVKG